MRPIVLYVSFCYATIFWFVFANSFSFRQGHQRPLTKVRISNQKICDSSPMDL